MKKAILVYNQNAGGMKKSISLEEIMILLMEAEIDAVYQTTTSEEDLDEILKDPPELVIAAGGDGTIRGVAKRIINKKTTLGILPLGTANNFARSLGIKDNPAKILKSLSNAKTKKIDIGRIVAPWGEDVFLEGVGFGLFADMLKKYRPVTDKNISRALSSFFQGITNVKSYKSRLTLDGQDITGDYLLVEILNTEAVGPRLTFAPGARLNDGNFNVIRVSKGENIAAFALNLFTKNIKNIAGVKISKAKKVSFLWRGFPIHIDGDILPDVNEKINYWYATGSQDNFKYENNESQLIHLDVMEKQLEVLAPNLK